MPAYTYTVILEPIAAGGYIAHCPSLPGVSADGQTPAEAHKKAREAIAKELESLKQAGRPIPEDHGAILSLERVTLPDDL
ncbi:MAG: type II toxin-antitoxin system HicB family antitoxin [Rhodomicrobium sp.]